MSAPAAESSPPHRAGDLDALAAALRSGDATATAIVADALERIAAGEDARDVLGTRRGPGARTPQTVKALAERNRLIRGCVAQFLPDESATEAARQLALALARYRSTGWSRDRSEVQCPPRLAGRISGHFWAILKARDVVPSERLIRDVLAGN